MKTMKNTHQNLLLALGAITNALDYFEPDHPQRFELEVAHKAILEELINENQTCQ